MYIYIYLYIHMYIYVYIGRTGDAWMFMHTHTTEHVQLYALSSYISNRDITSPCFNMGWLRLVGTL